MKIKLDIRETKLGRKRYRWAIRDAGTNDIEAYGVNTFLTKEEVFDNLGRFLAATIREIKRIDLLHQSENPAETMYFVMPASTGWRWREAMCENPWVIVDSSDRFDSESDAVRDLLAKIEARDSK